MELYQEFYYCPPIKDASTPKPGESSDVLICSDQANNCEEKMDAIFEDCGVKGRKNPSSEFSVIYCYSLNFQILVEEVKGSQLESTLRDLEYPLHDDNILDFQTSRVIQSKMTTLNLI
eukprot:gb/GECH01009083.1/.p1 GENE.gb/GECH01009083.1/~~gb/GECH01009083.1/.p1  ORF type:complete len:118 (+),score=28.26 gb/GECH01009083.1/:1-354(+)